MATPVTTARASRPPPVTILGFNGPRTHRLDRNGGTVWFEGFVRGHTPESVAEAGLRQTADSIATWLAGLDGFFRIAVDTSNFVFAACDPVRSYPLVWARDQAGTVLISAAGPDLERRLSLGPDDLNTAALEPLALSGFTIGNDTIYRNVSQIGPGQFLWIDADGVNEERYYLWSPWNPGDVDMPEALSGPLGSLHERLIDDLVKDAAGRQILVPLSAGLDSRFIASGLREAGYENVLCVTYGLAGNREAEASKDIARRLGYEWRFVPYTNTALSKMFHSGEYREFKACSDSLTAIHFPQEFHALDTLLKRGEIDRDTMVVNGQSGDFITGNHIPPTLFNASDDPEERQSEILNAILAKHYRQWSALRTPDRLARITERLRAEIDRKGLSQVSPAGAHGVYEFLEFQDRQSKYVINGQRLYDHFGMAWRLPLWERSYLDFWATAPLAAKRGQSLYKTVLHDTNWAKVWQDIPINPMRIRPDWIRPLRFIAKAGHAPFGDAGRSAWHRFEKRYMEYWMGTTCAYAAWPYRKIAGDRRGHYSAIAWHIEDYLGDKGVNWDGRPIGVSE